MFEAVNYTASDKPSKSTVIFPVRLETKKKNGMPIPPRRPEKFHASESFIKEARLNNDMPEPIAYSNNEQLENLLRDPSAEEILKQLE